MISSIFVVVQGGARHCLTVALCSSDLPNTKNPEITNEFIRIIGTAGRSPALFLHGSLLTSPILTIFEHEGSGDVCRRPSEDSLRQSVSPRPWNRFGRQKLMPLQHYRYFYRLQSTECRAWQFEILYCRCYNLYCTRSSITSSIIHVLCSVYMFIIFAPFSVSHIPDSPF